VLVFLTGGAGACAGTTLIVEGLVAAALEAVGVVAAPSEC